MIRKIAQAIKIRPNPLISINNVMRDLLNKMTNKMTKMRSKITLKKLMEKKKKKLNQEARVF